MARCFRSRQHHQAVVRRDPGNLVMLRFFARQFMQLIRSQWRPDRGRHLDCGGCRRLNVINPRREPPCHSVVSRARCIPIPRRSIPRVERRWTLGSRRGLRLPQPSGLISALNRRHGGQASSCDRHRGPRVLSIRLRVRRDRLVHPRHIRRRGAPLSSRRIPGRLGAHATLIKGVAALDSTVIHHDGLWWLFCTDRDAGSNSKLRIWFAPQLLGPWDPIPSTRSRPTSAPADRGGPRSSATTSSIGPPRMDPIVLAGASPSTGSTC